MRESWQRIELGDIADVFAGGTPRTTDPSYWEGGKIVWVTPTDITALRGRDLSDSARKITELGLDKSSARMASKGSILVTSRATIGAAAIAGCDVALNQGVTALVPGDGVDGGWIYYWVTWARDEMTARAAGSTFLEISRAKMRRLPVALPPLEEQRRISDLLETIDRHIELSLAELDGSKRLLDALRRHVVDQGPDEAMPLGHFLKGIEGGRSLRSLERPPEPGERAVLKVSAVKPGLFVATEAKALSDEAEMPARALVRRGDVLMTRANTAELVGAVCRVAEPVEELYLSDKTLRLVFDEERADPNYFVHALAAPSVRHQLGLAATGTSGSMKNVSQEKIRALQVRAPVDVEKQREFGEAFECALASLRGAGKRTEALRRLRSSLIRALYSGAHEIPKSYDRFVPDNGASLDATISAV